MRKRTPIKKKINHTLNDRIRHPKLRLISEGLTSEGFPKGEIYSLDSLIEFAYSQDKDVILLGTKGDFPLCEVMKYSDFIYKQKQKEKLNKKTALKDKEIRFKIDTGEHDMTRYLKNAIEWSEKGHQVKITLNLRGRDMSRKDMAELKILQFVKDLGDKISILQEPKLEGRRFIAKVKSKK